MPQHARAARRSPAAPPLHHRRVSGPAARPRGVPAVARVGGVGVPRVRGRTGPFGRLLALPERRLADRVLRGRLCIWVIGVMLGGIVAMQVSQLRLNSGISRAMQTASTLERQNADLESSISKLTSADRVRVNAARVGMIDPLAGDTHYLRARPTTDPARAAKHLQPPSEQALKVMANNGRASGALTAAPATTAAPTTVVAAATPAGATLAAVAPAAPVATPQAATATPIPAVPADAGTGAAVAPEG